MNGNGRDLRYRIEREITYPSTEWGFWGDAWHSETNHFNMADKIPLATGNTYTRTAGNIVL